MDNIRMPSHECPCCGSVHDAASGVNCHDRPVPGDVTICIKCGAICRFERGMTMSLIGDTSLPLFDEARKIQKKVRQVRGLPV